MKKSNKNLSQPLGENEPEQEKMMEAEFNALDAPVENEGKKKEKKKKPVLTEQELKVRRSKRNKIAVAAFVLLLGVGVMGNWYYENTDLSSSIKPLINTSQTKTLGEAEYVGATTEAPTQSENEYFSQSRVDRQTARDEAMEKLQAVVDKTDESEDARKEASEEIAKLSKHISIENKIETLVSAKGVNNCLAVVSEDGDRVDVIVDVEELTDNIILQIKEIAMKQLGCGFEDVSIIQSKS